MGQRQTGVLTGLIALLAPLAALAEPCIPNQVDVMTGGGPVTFAVEVADDDATRARGLMERTDLGPDEGMLFVYPFAGEVSFWMKNTPLPLDIVFINRRGVICSIAANTTPYSEELIPSLCAAQTVLEVNAGVASARGLRIGAAVRHPAVEAPVWRCDK